LCSIQTIPWSIQAVHVSSIHGSTGILPVEEMTQGQDAHATADEQAVFSVREERVFMDQSTRRWNPPSTLTISPVL
ncbi:MAG: hypothetical protein WCL27_10740, partial [Betaproteobacteria bacterium]